jgi:hypothetical protein
MHQQSAGYHMLHPDHEGYQQYNILILRRSTGRNCAKSTTLKLTEKYLKQSKVSHLDSLWEEPNCTRGQQKNIYEE